MPVWDPTNPATTNQLEPEYAIGVDEEVVYFPYTVPTGWNLYISDIHFASKHVEYNGTTRNSYMHLLITWPNTWQTMITAMSGKSDPSFNTPFIIKQGCTLRWVFANNGPEVENMTGVATGYLRKAT